MRLSVPIFGFIALAALFFSMPETPNLFNFYACKQCSTENPYLAIIGSGYFTALITLYFLFPNFPNRDITQGGLFFSCLLSLVLTAQNLPKWCPTCLISHTCHILIWLSFWKKPSINKAVSPNFNEKICLSIFTPISMMAFFSCMNITFMAYNFKSKNEILITTLRPGDAIPSFSKNTSSGNEFANSNLDKPALLNFISPNCPFCQEQLQMLNGFSKELLQKSFRIINVSESVNEELLATFQGGEWIEDKEGVFRKLFKVSGYPTLFLLKTNGQIAHVFPGMSEEIKNVLSLMLKDENKSGALASRP